MNVRTGIDLFAGIGGFSLAMQMNNVQVIEQVEIEPYPIKVLEKNFPEVRRHGDIRTYKPDANPWIICGGFPCQDISTAGKGAGLSGERSGLWWQMHRVIKESEPDWVLIENVPALRTRGSDEVLLSLEEIGYASEPLVVGASDVGASHKRKRVWIVGYSDSQSRRACSLERWGAMVEAVEIGEESKSTSILGDANSNRVREQPGWRCWTDGKEAAFSASVSGNSGHLLVNSERTRCERRNGECTPESTLRFPAYPGERQHEWEQPRSLPAESRLGRTIDGISGRVDKHRIKALGNAIVPHLAALIISAIIQTEDQVNSEK